MPNSNALSFDSLSELRSTVREHGESIASSTTRLTNLEDRQKEDRMELKEFRKESRDRWFTGLLFSIGQIVTLLGVGATIYFTVKGK